MEAEKNLLRKSLEEMNHRSSRGEKKDIKGGTEGDQEKKVIKMRSNEEKLGRSRERRRRKKQRLRGKLLLREKSFISPKKVLNVALFTL